MAMAKIHFLCPSCGSTDTPVYKTIKTKSGISRYRRCAICNERIKTIEIKGKEVIDKKRVKTRAEDYPCDFDCDRCPYRDCMREGKDILLFEKWLYENNLSEKEYVFLLRKGKIKYD